MDNGFPGTQNGNSIFSVKRNRESDLVGVLRLGNPRDKHRADEIIEGQSAGTGLGEEGTLDVLR